MSINDYAYVKGISKELVDKLIEQRKIDWVKLDGEKYIYLRTVYRKMTD